MSDTNDPTPIDKMTEQQLRAASIAALPKVDSFQPAPAPATGGVPIHQMTPQQQRNAAMAGLPVVMPRPAVTPPPTPTAPTPRYRFDAMRGTVLDNPDDFPPSAA